MADLAQPSGNEASNLIAGDVIECSLNKTELHDFWRADPRGRMFLSRLLQEDTSPHRMEAGRYFDLTLPIWRTGECLPHAGRLAKRLGASTVDLTMTWRGLKGRELVAYASGSRWVDPSRVCEANEVRTSTRSDAAAINDTLPELVQELVEPLLVRFDFFEPGPEIYAEELARMRRGE